LLIALFGVSLINATLFGCTMRPGAGATVGGYGAVACMSGQDGTAGTDVNTLACEWQYFNLTTAPTASHFHIGDDNTVSGNITFTFTISGLTKVSGIVYQKFTATSGWSQQGGLSFDQQVSACAGGSGCYFNLHTSGFPTGELRCQLSPITATYDYTTTLTPPAANINANMSTGTATVQMGTITPAATPALHAWGYQVSFSLISPITLAHIHQGTSSDNTNSGPIKVTFDQGPQRTVGKFVGVALEGTVPAGNVPPSSWPSYTSDFDTAMGNHFNYINVHSVAYGGGEIRAQISPVGSGASQVSLAILAVFFMIASWMSL